MADSSNVISDLKQLRDELRLQIHLGTTELQDEWERLEMRWTEFSGQAELEQSAKDVAESVAHVAEDLKLAYERVKLAL